MNLTDRNLQPVRASIGILDFFRWRLPNTAR